MLCNRAILRSPGRLSFFCPGCSTFHSVSVNTAGARWSWNQSLELPTLTPSIHVTDDGGATVCHSYVRNGEIQFLSDSTHALAGQMVDLPVVQETV